MLSRGPRIRSRTRITALRNYRWTACITRGRATELERINIMNKHYAALALFVPALFMISWSNLGAQRETGPAGVPNYTRVDATVACAGATSVEALAELK